MLRVEAQGKHKRIRRAELPFSALPPLSASQQGVLRQWLGSDALERRWQSLLDTAGVAHLDTADTLLHRLLNAGAVAVKEEFVHGQWRPWRVVWTDLQALQRAVGVATQAERQANKADLTTGLQGLAQEHPWLAEAAQACLTGPAPVQAARATLLQALATWHLEQRSGMRQDFALHARTHTKAISPGEWDWLERHIALEAVGIARFAPLLLIGGALTLHTPSGPAGGGDLALHGLHFVGLPCGQFAPPLAVRAGPESYWLIENRASFERQARRVEAGVCIVWLPGRPGSDWLAAVRWLLQAAPAPATISCDPDPAGIQIAATAGRLWDEARLAWQAKHMAPAVWQNGKTLALTDYDRRVLSELQAQPDLPTGLAELREYLHTSGRKAEQEGWL